MTPLPWKADAQYIHGPNGHRFIAVCDPEDSVAIVRAVNNHDALVAALANALNTLEYLAPEEFDNAEHEATWKASLAHYHETLASATQP